MQDELFLATRFAKAWNTLDISVIEPWIDEDCVYVSHVSSNNWVGKTDYLKFFSNAFDYLRESIERHSEIMGAEVGYYRGSPCMIMRHLHHPVQKNTFYKIYVNGEEKLMPKFLRMTECLHLLIFREGKICRSDIYFLPDAS